MRSQGHVWRWCFAVSLLSFFFFLCSKAQDCISNVKDLANTMEAEAIAAVFYGNATREPPFRYILCPDTVYTITKADFQIFVYLDETYILCGDDGALSNNCLLRERIKDKNNNDNDEEELPVGGGGIVLLEFLENYIRGITVFAGFTMDGLRVSAHDFFPARVVFLDCHWKKSFGSTMIDIEAPGEISSIGQSSMVVEIVDCIMEDQPREETRLFAAVRNIGGTLRLSNVTLRNLNADHFVSLFAADTSILDCRFANSVLEEGIFMYTSLTNIVNSTFVDNSLTMASCVGLDAATVVTGSEFVGNTGFTDISMVGVVRDEPSVLLFVVDSCFDNGNYTVGPVFTGGQGNYRFENIHIGTGVDGDCPTHPFLESQEAPCLDDNALLKQGQVCQGTCGNVTFAAQTCAVALRQDCVNHNDGVVELWQKIPKNRQDCAWLAAQPDATVVDWHCKTWNKVRRACRLTCKACRPFPKPCLDKTNRFFPTFQRQFQSCLWLAKRNFKKQRQICQGSPQAQDACPLTCETCPE